MKTLLETNFNIGDVVYALRDGKDVNNTVSYHKGQKSRVTHKFDIGNNWFGADFTRFCLEKKDFSLIRLESVNNEYSIY